MRERRWQTDIYHYQNPTEFLCDIYLEKKKKNHRFSLRAWSRQLGYRNPSYLSAVLTGQRPLTIKAMIPLANSLLLTDEEKAYFELMILGSRARSETERAIYVEHLSRASSKKNHQSPK